MKYNKKTIDYFVNMEDANGWSHTSLRILQYVTEEVNEMTHTTSSSQFKIEKRFKILTEQVEIKILRELLGHEK